MTVVEKTEVTVDNIKDIVWSGAKHTLEDLSDEQIETILDILDDAEDGEMDITEFNDFFWHERDTIAEWLGFENYDELMDSNEDY